MQIATQLSDFTLTVIRLTEITHHKLQRLFFSTDKYIVHLTYLCSLKEEFWFDYNTYQEMTLY